MEQLDFKTILSSIVLLYYLIINIVLFAAMVIDKNKAIKNRRRIPEKTLFMLSVLGGGLGGLIAMFAKRHKTRHIDFILVFTVTTLLYFCVLYLLIGKFVLGI